MDESKIQVGQISENKTIETVKKDENLNINEGRSLDAFRSENVTDNKTEIKLDQARESVKANEQKDKVKNSRSLLRENFRKTKTRMLNVKKVNSAIATKSVKRLVKKNWIKPNEYVYDNVNYYGSSEKLLEQRAENANFIKEGSFALRDMKADYRINTDIKVKAAVGFHEFNRLSQFYQVMMTDMDKNAFNEMVVKYGKEKGTADRFEVLDKITAKIMDIDPSSYDFSSDRAIAQRASAFENMDAMVSAYRELIEDNPEYVEHLKEVHDENDAESYYQKLMNQMEKVTAMSDYYRIRKMIMSDSEYIAFGGDIGIEIKESDSKGTKHLKEMLHASYRLATRLNKALGSNDIEAPEPILGENALSKSTYEKLDKVFTGELENQDNNIIILDEMQEDDVMKREDMIRDELNRFKREGDSIADISIRDCLGKLTDISRTVYDKKEKKNKKVKGVTSYVALYGGTSMAYDDVYLTYQGDLEDRKRNDLIRRLRALKAKTWNGLLSHIGSFASKKYPELAQMHMADRVERMIEKKIMDLGDDLTDNEIIELVEHELISETKEYFKRFDVYLKKDNNEKLTDEESKLPPVDKDVYEYYEDAYADAAMRSLYKHNALFEKIEQALGAKALLLHPADLAVKYPESVQRLLGSYFTITNILTDANRPLVKKFADDYDKVHGKRNKYKFDVDKFNDCGDLYSNLNFKVGYFDYVRVYLAKLYLESKGEQSQFNDPEFGGMTEKMYNKIKSRAGKLGITAKVVDDCYEQHKDEDIVRMIMENNRMHSSQTGEPEEVNQKVAVYMYYHPEIIQTKLLGFIEPEHMDSVYLQAYGKVIDTFKKAYEHGYVHDVSVEELDEYEADMKERGLQEIKSNLAENMIVFKSDKAKKPKKADKYKVKEYRDIISGDKNNDIIQTK